MKNNEITIFDNEITTFDNKNTIFDNKNLLKEFEFEVKGLKELLKRLQHPRELLKRQVNNENHKIIAKEQELYATYPTREQAQEAYGYGEITQAQYDKLMDLFDNIAVKETQQGLKNKYELALYELDEFISRTTHIVNNREADIRRMKEGK